MNKFPFEPQSSSSKFHRWTVNDHECATAVTEGYPNIDEAVSASFYPLVYLEHAVRHQGMKNSRNGNH